jgi:hypothetical protein
MQTIDRLGETNKALAKTNGKLSMFDDVNAAKDEGRRGD